MRASHLGVRSQFLLKWHTPCCDERLSARDLRVFDNENHIRDLQPFVKRIDAMRGFRLGARS